MGAGRAQWIGETGGERLPVPGRVTRRPAVGQPAQNGPGRQQDVLWSDCAVHEAHAVKVGERGGERGDNRCDRLDRRRRRVGEGVAHDAPGDEDRLRGVTALDQLDDAGVPGPLEQSSFAGESVGLAVLREQRLGHSGTLEDIAIYFNQYHVSSIYSMCERVCHANRYAICMAQMVTRVDDRLAKAVDELVEAGVVASRSEAVRLGLRGLVDRYERDRIGGRIVEGYRAAPQSEADVGWADEASIRMIADEAW